MLYINGDQLEKLTKNLPGAPTEIDYSDICGMRETCVDEVAEILTVNTTVTKFAIGFYNRLGYNSLQKLFAALCVNKTLKILDVSFHQITDEDMKVLTAMLSVNHTIAELNFRSCRISPEGLKCLAGVLRVNRGIKKINLSNNVPDMEAIKELTGVLAENNTLIQLDFDWALNKQWTIYFADMLQKNKTLQKLSLLYCDFGDNGAKELARGLEKNNTLTELNLTGSRIGPDEAAALAKALTDNTAMTTLILASNPIGNKGAHAFGEVLNSNQNLITLNLQRCKIDDAGGSALCASLANNKGLKNLVLEGNELGNKAAQALGKALAINTTLLTLSLENNEIQLQGGIALAAGIGCNQTIVELNLSKNQVGGIGFAASMKDNRTLVRLNLGHNQFGPEAVVALAHTIKNHSRLIHLILKDNQAGDKGAIAFAQTLADKNVRGILAHLDLDGNGITPKSANALVKFISNNQRLPCFRIASNPFSIQGLRNTFVTAANNPTLVEFCYPEERVDSATRTAISHTLSSNQKKALALIDAVYNKDVRRAKQLLDSHVSPYLYKNMDAKKNVKIILPDVDADADKNKIVFPYGSPNNETLLHIAVRQEDLPMLQLLLKHKMAAALSKIPNQENETAVQLAKNLENSIFYEAFVAAGCHNERSEDAPPPAKRARYAPDWYVPTPW